MHQSDLIKLIQIINTDSIGPITFFKLLKTYKSIQKIFDILPEVIKNKNIKIPTEEFALKELEKATKENIKIITYDDTEYPNKLKSIYAKPVIIYAKGNIELLNKNIVAIVGSRNASINAKKFTEIISSEISKSGFPIISGMAIGIDTSAHTGAITNNQANTIAVLAGGVNNIYPKQNTALYKEILNKNGLIISEQNINYTAKAQDFPKRNRIISALSTAVILTEATSKSGSLITIKNAMEQGKLIYAIPSHPSDPKSYGPNKLISEGGKIFTSSKLFIKELNDFIANKEETIVYNKHINIETLEQEIENKPNQKIKVITKTTDKAEKIEIIKTYILTALSQNGNSIDELLSELKTFYKDITYQELSEAILYLELENKILNSNKIYKIQ